MADAFALVRHRLASKLTQPMAGVMSAATVLAYVLHIGGGTVGLVSGTIAAFAKKGEQLHRVAGTVFFIAMIFMATFAAYLALVVPGQMSNLAGALLTLYLLITAWITVRRPDNAVGPAEKIALGVSLCLTVVLLIPVIAAAAGAAPELKGPFLIAANAIAGLVVVAAIGDLRLVRAGGIAGVSRIARHLWRMLTALVFSYGSAFTNGLPRLLPGPFHVPPIFFAPMLLPLGLLVFWMIRVRFTRWEPPARLSVFS